jgi:hypothetical protein
MKMGMEICFPQLEEMLDRDAAIKDLLKTIADRMNALERAIAAITPTPPQPTPDQPELPMAKVPPEPKKPRRAKAAASNGEDSVPQHEDDEAEEDLRARAAFEARRTTRLFGIAGTRATIRKVAGPTVLSIDDVPVAKLPALIEALQAL